MGIWNRLVAHPRVLQCCISPGGGAHFQNVLRILRTEISNVHWYLGSRGLVNKVGKQYLSRLGQYQSILFESLNLGPSLCLLGKYYVLPRIQWKFFVIVFLPVLYTKLSAFFICIFLCLLLSAFMNLFTLCKDQIAYDLRQHRECVHISCSQDTGLEHGAPA